MSSPERVRVWQPLREVTLERHGDPAPDFAELEKRERVAFHQGYSEASAAINQQLLEQRQELSEVCEKLFRSLEESVTSAVGEVREALPGLTMQALRRVLSRVDVTRELVNAVVEELLSEIGPDVGPIELRLHPADLEFVQDIEAHLARNHPGLSFVAHEGLKRGDCEAATRFGKVDARMDNKLDKLEASMAAR